MGHAMSSCLAVLEKLSTSQQCFVQKTPHCFFWENEKDDDDDFIFIFSFVFLKLFLVHLLWYLNAASSTYAEKGRKSESIMQKSNA